MILILRCADIEKTRAFYEHRGYVFTKEKHGDGPDHYAWSRDDIVVELYPAEDKDGRRAGETTIMLNVSEPHSTKPTVSVVRDPDGRRVLQNHV